MGRFRGVVLQPSGPLVGQEVGEMVDRMRKPAVTVRLDREAARREEHVDVLELASETGTSRSERW